MHETLPDSHLEIVEGAGHAPFLSHPERVADLIRHFLLDAEKRRVGAGDA